jgi:TolB protein
MDADGTHVRRLTENPGFDRWPAWSQDGRRIMFSSVRDGDPQPDIYAVDVDGGDPAEVIDSPAFDFGAAWTFDEAAR